MPAAATPAACKSIPSHKATQAQKMIVLRPMRRFCTSRFTPFMLDSYSKLRNPPTRIKMLRLTARCVLQSIGSKVPSFSLYGEQAVSVAETDSLHIEDIQSRSRKYLWRIGTHRHTVLCQCILVTAGPV